MGNSITLFVDESGTVPKDRVCNNGYFIITILSIKNDDISYVKKVFKKARLNEVKKKKFLYQKLSSEHEIKGSELTETQKANIYQKVFKKCGDKIELAVIALNLQEATDRFRSNSSRVFNYLIKFYLDKYFRKNSKFDNITQMQFIIDERNVATKSKYTLQEYLNTELNMTEDLSHEDIIVKYYDSKKFLLLQLADFISNTFYRNLQKNNKESEQNVSLLLKYTCKNEIFKFPNKN